MEIMLKLRFVFAREVFLLRHNYVTYFFDVVTSFCDVGIMLHFSTFEFRTEGTLQLRFVFVRHCDLRRN